MGGEGRAKKKRVLLAEDDADMREILTFWLEGEGFEVTAVSNGREAIAAALAKAPDCAIIDLLMPDVDGFQTCRYFRCDERLSKIPVVLFTAVFLEEEERELARECGADAFLEKSRGFRALVKEVGELAASGVSRAAPLPPEVGELIRSEVGEISPAVH